MENQDLYSPVLNLDGRTLYEEILRATEDFNPEYCVGEGGFGSVYKATLPSVCSKHSFLVYEYVERGSLAKILNVEEKAKEFDWTKRVNIVKGVADALSYMHSDAADYS
ncbi:putative LRR receptor-like serine/threonine-protein kinase [Morus notabilis]|uniref:non-specific serine/threonine protein kinase n=1 Tax=Morus notabilis TaxID=981085 RepID=W9S3B7_9ROSA|nr:putative LRR receptor-like serine/threonine-protein kinase [Morus notabilis]